MKEYKEMIHTYHESISLLKSRIDELNEKIRTHKGDSQEALGSLVDRRYKLYQEVWELQGDIRMMGEYIEAVEERNLQKTLAIA